MNIFRIRIIILIQTVRSYHDQYIYPAVLHPRHGYPHIVQFYADQSPWDRQHYKSSDPRITVTNKQQGIINTQSVWLLHCIFLQQFRSRNIRNINYIELALIILRISYRLSGLHRHRFPSTTTGSQLLACQKVEIYSGLEGSARL